MYPRFGLTLMVTHACNLRCSYCYTGAKYNRAMPQSIGRAAIDRAFASLQIGGCLELGFFGGEPLLEASLIEDLVTYARDRTQARDLSLAMALTTNGTVTGPQAWSVMMMPELELAISCDGRPQTHDRHRRTTTGQGSSAQVLATLARLVELRRSFRVVVVVRPDTLDALPDNLAFLRDLGVPDVQPSLDLWTTWRADDVDRLEHVIARCARLWRETLPDGCVGWFDEKVGPLAGICPGEGTRCGFGRGEVAVAPSGRVYPCERLIGDDAPDNPMAIFGHVEAGRDFCDLPDSPARDHPACGGCAMRAECNTSCRCSNYVRTGNVSRPDSLLCRFNQACLTETVRVLNHPVPLTMHLHG